MERIDESTGAVLPPAQEQPPVATGPDDLPETVNDAQGGGLAGLMELWRYRDLLLILAWRDVKVRYKQTFLGVAWAVLQPVSIMVVFSLVLGRLSSHDPGDTPYPIYVFTGLLPWLFFATAVSHVANSIVASEALVSKVYFPRLIVPLASIGSSLADFVVSLVVLALLMVYYRVSPPWPGLLLAPVVIVFFVLAALGVGTFLAALNVTYRDFRYVVPFLLQLWMFATPAIYVQPPKEGGQGPAPLIQATGSVLDYNPMNPAIGAFRATVLGGREISWGPLGIVAGLAVVCACAGFFFFRRAEDTFADVI
jgi:lipopolysaccharide transport system permease protein